MAVSEEDAESRKGSESQYPWGGGRNFNYARTTSSWTGTDDRKWTSWIITTFAVANIAMFIIVILVNNCPKNHPKRYGSCVGTCLGRFSFEPLEENPLIGPFYSTLVKLGAINSYAVVNQHERWRLFSSIWLHAGVVHLLVNIIVFFSLVSTWNRNLDSIGAIYLLSGFGGSILSTLFISNIFSVSVGASGALFGLLGAMLSYTLMNWTIYSNKVCDWTDNAFP